MERNRDLPKGDVFETKLHRLHVGGGVIETATVSALAGGAVHEVVTERLPADETGRLVTAAGAATCAYCGAPLSGEVASAFVCRAPGCGRIACEQHRFLNADNEIRCAKHDPWRALVELLWGTGGVGAAGTAGEGR